MLFYIFLILRRAQYWYFLFLRNWKFRNEHSIMRMNCSLITDTWETKIVCCWTHKQVWGSLHATKRYLCSRHWGRFAFVNSSSTSRWGARHSRHTPHASRLTQHTSNIIENGRRSCICINESNVPVVHRTPAAAISIFIATSISIWTSWPWSIVSAAGQTVNGNWGEKQSILRVFVEIPEQSEKPQINKQTEIIMNSNQIFEAFAALTNKQQGERHRKKNPLNVLVCRAAGISRWHAAPILIGLVLYLT